MKDHKNTVHDLSLLKTLAHILDNQFRIPFTGFRLGLDGLLGMIPGIGDTITLIISLFILLQAFRFKIPVYAKLLMLKNIFFDWLFGLIPFVGDLFDMRYRSNVKNINVIIENLQNKNIKK